MVIRNPTQRRFAQHRVAICFVLIKCKKKATMFVGWRKCVSVQHTAVVHDHEENAFRRICTTVSQRMGHVFFGAVNKVEICNDHDGKDQGNVE